MLLLETGISRQAIVVSAAFTSALVLFAPNGSSGSVIDEQKQSDNPDWFSAGAQFGPVFNHSHFIKDHNNDAMVFIDPANPTDTGFWKWGGDNDDDYGTITEVDVPGGKDSVAVNGYIQHLTGVHAGEGPNPNPLPFDLSIQATSNEAYVYNVQFMNVVHQGNDVHRDGLLAAIGGLSRNDEFLSYGLCFVAAHNPVPPPNPNDPNPQPLPFGSTSLIPDSDLVDWVGEGGVGGGAIFAINDEDGFVNMAVSGASFEPLEIISADICFGDVDDGFCESIHTFTPELSVSIDENETTSFLGGVEFSLSELGFETAELLNSSLFIDIETDGGHLRGQLSSIGLDTVLPIGDFDRNGELDIIDIDLLSGESAAGTNDPLFDLSLDEIVDSDDVTIWIRDHFNSWIGDANLDGEFNSADFVQVFAAGKFELNENASWGDGDWNGDGRFNSSDFVAAFSDGGFEFGPRVSLQSVPEPSGVVLCVMTIVALLGIRRK